MLGISTPSQATSLNDLADGDYSNGSLILRKSGNIILGARSKDSICFRGRLFNGKIATRGDVSPIFADQSGNYRRRFTVNFNEKFPISASSLNTAKETEKAALDQCIGRFRPLINLGINVGMADTAVQDKLSKLNWQRSYKSPISYIPNRNSWAFDDDGVLCDQGGNFCILTWRKQEMELSITVATGVPVNNRPPVVEICLTHRVSSGRTCQFSDINNDDGTQ